MRSRDPDQRNFFNPDDVLLQCVLREQPCSKANFDGGDILGSESVAFAATSLRAGSLGKGKVTP
jgi:hypothetical protein